MQYELDKGEKRKLYRFFPKDAPLTLDNLFKYGVHKIAPDKRLPFPDSHRESMTVEFLYHGGGWHLDCYMRFSEREKYYGAGCGCNFQYLPIALARVLISAFDDLEELKKKP